MRHIAPTLLAVSLLSLPLAAPAQETDPHITEVDGARVLYAWAVPEDDGLQVYMEIENTGSVGLLLTGGETADGGTLALRDTEVTAAAPVDLSEFPIAPGVSIDLVPGGMYLALDDAPDLSEGDRLNAHIELDPVGDVEIEIDILAPGTRDHPDAEHRQ